MATMLPADWLAYIAQQERTFGQRPADAPKKPQGVGKGRNGLRNVSPRQRQAESGKLNTVKAIYDTPNYRNGAILANGNERFTTELGGNCESAQQAHGKRTR